MKRFIIILAVVLTVGVGSAWAESIVTAKDAPPVGTFRSFTVEADGSFVPCISLTTPKGTSLACDFMASDDIEANIDSDVEVDPPGTVTVTVP